MTPADGGAAEDWIVHAGGICPVEVDIEVMYRRRDGRTSDAPARAGSLRWDHGRSPEAAADRSRGDGLSDIVAYRVVQS